MPPEEDNKQGIIKWIIAVAVIVLLAIIGLVLLMTVGKDTGAAKAVGKVMPFGALSPETTRTGFSGTGGDDGTGGGDGDKFVASDDAMEPLFRQITTRQIAGATTVIRDGKTYVRYVLRENGRVHEVDTSTWNDVELTITTLPRVYEAYFGNNGNTVVLRYLKLDQLTRQDVIKTFLADLVLPESGVSDGTGELRGRDVADSVRKGELFDNISSVSISPNGSLLFFLRPLADGVAGYSVDLTDGSGPREILRNSFREWLPQILDNGNIILTTKASADVLGFAYLYNPKASTLTRLIREKNGLTTLGNSDGGRVIYSENIGGISTLGLYDQKGFSSEEGVMQYEKVIQLTTLPEKCTWGKTHQTIFYCASFQYVSNRQIPDQWYQGLVHFKDSFWIANSESEQIALLAIPENEVKKSFDAFMPFIASDDSLFFFTDKNTSFLWVIHIKRPDGVITEESESQPTTPPPTPEEAGDAAGSASSTTP